MIHITVTLLNGKELKSKLIKDLRDAESLMYAIYECTDNGLLMLEDVAGFKQIYRASQIASVECLEIQEELTK